MAKNSQSLQSSIPSVDKLLRLDAAQPLLDEYGHQMCTEALRQVIDETRRALADNGEAALPLTEEAAVISRLNDRLTQMSAASLRPVINLTGTVLHTNLGRAPLPQEAIDAMCVVAGGASNLEYDLASGKRGDRDTHIDDLLAEITGAEAATVVNNNAAAVLLVLNTLANRKEVPVSRGELIEIGGAFRIPDIMKRAGAKLVEIGTTNRTHLKDYAEAISPRTATLMKVHTSNYTVQGFTKEVTGKELSALAREHDLPLIEDLGSGTLVDLSRYGLPHEPTAQETLANGVDVVTFSGDKLLGGPQAGLIVGTKELVQKIKMNPMKRALRLDKVTIAALTAVLQLYRDPDRLAQRVPTIRLLARSEADIRAVADRVKAPVAEALGENYVVRMVEVQSQIGSGSLPVERLPSVALAIEPMTGSRGSALKKLASAFRGLPIPVIGRTQDDAFLLDLRCLGDEDTFLGQLSGLGLKS